MENYNELFVKQETIEYTPMTWEEAPYVWKEKYSAVIKIGSWHINLINKTFTEEQIKNMREFFGWEVENLCESQSET